MAPSQYLTWARRCWLSGSPGWPAAFFASSMRLLALSRTSLAVSSTMACTAGSDVRAATPLAAWASDRSPPATSRAAIPGETGEKKEGKRDLHCQVLIPGVSCQPCALQLAPIPPSSSPHTPFLDLPTYLHNSHCPGQPLPAAGQWQSSLLWCCYPGPGHISPSRDEGGVSGGSEKKEMGRLSGEKSDSFNEVFSSSGAQVGRKSSGFEEEQGLTVSPGKGLSLPSRAAAFTSCRSLSRFCTTLSAESISKGPHAS